MTAKTTSSPQQAAGKASGAQDAAAGDKQARLSKALRENLRKRKAQARARSDSRKGGGGKGTDNGG